MAEPRKPRREPRASAVPREVLRSIDDSERRVSLALAGIGFVFSIASVVAILFVKPKTTYIIQPIKNGSVLSCHKGYHLVAKMCEQTRPTPASQLWITFAVITVAAAVVLIAALQRRRTLIVASCLLIGLALGAFSFGLPFVITGVWLMWRAWRLQRYGVAKFSEVSQITRQQALDRREGRTPSTPRAASTASAPPTDRPRRPSEPSKRYTPKKPPRKKR